MVEAATPAVPHGAKLAEILQTYLNAQVPLGGGWLTTRLEEPTYPFGTIDVLSSQPVRGQGYYSEDHQLVIAVWHRPKAGQKPDPMAAAVLSLAMVRALTLGILSQPGFEVTQLVCGQSTPQNPDGLTCGRQVIATAVTHEVRNG